MISAVNIVRTVSALPQNNNITQISYYVKI